MVTWFSGFSRQRKGKIQNTPDLPGGICVNTHNIFVSRVMAGRQEVYFVISNFFVACLSCEVI